MRIIHIVIFVIGCAAFFAFDVLFFGRAVGGSTRGAATLSPHDASAIEKTQTQCSSTFGKIMQSSVLVERNCAQWWALASEAGSCTDPPERPPSELLEAYSLNGKAEIAYLYYSNVYAGGEARRAEWTHELVQGMLERGETLYTDATYGIFDETLKRYPVQNKRGLVVGSESPWVEAFLLGRGATHVTTLEYGAIHSTDARIATFTPAEAAQAYYNGTFGPFDFVFTYSSIEHSGLGRYGDRLNPHGDLEVMQRLKCVVKPGGLIYVGLPMSTKDCVVFNAHRIYGPVRRALLAEGLELLSVVPAITSNDCVRIDQPIQIMRVP